MAENTRTDHDRDIPAQGQPLDYGDAADDPSGHTGLAIMTGSSGPGPTRRDFLVPGTLRKPGPIGRSVRALLGLASLYFVITAIIYDRVFF